MTETQHAWWAELRHGGMLVAPQILDEFFPALEVLDEKAYERLRSSWLRLAATSDEKSSVRDFVTELLEEFLGHDEGWQKASSVAGEFKATSVSGERLRPDRVLTGGSDGARLAVWFDEAKRIGIGRGRRTHAKAAELLRATGIPLGLITNGKEARLLHAGPDYDAWAEWSVESWFDEGEGRATLAGLATTLSGGVGDNDELPAIDRLIAAVRASRDRQGDLAQVLGEQVRQAVELLLTSLDHELEANPELRSAVWTGPGSGPPLADSAIHAALYQAATRMIMRLVLVFYAEARNLLPATLEAYHDSYGAEGLYRLLSEAARDGGELLAEKQTAWPRLVALFRLIHGGSPHPELAMIPYGGTLFRPGDLESEDPVLRAVAALESARPDDLVVLRLLRLLKVGRVKVRSGHGARWVAGPVDFSELRTEYIGIVYEGLLDYELRRAGEDDPTVILAVGRQPALPLSRLRGMSGNDLKELLKKFKKDADSAPDMDDQDVGESADAAEDHDTEDEEGVAAEQSQGILEGGDSREDAIRWAREAVAEAGLVRRPRGQNPDLATYERRCQEKAEALVQEVVPGGRLFLVASGNLRKGSGSFYTRPALAVPLAHRTLEPLCYQRQDDRLIPRTPEEILALKVCEPAMGSGSFLVAALRYLTEALARSLHEHERIRPQADREAIITLPLGDPAEGQEPEELLPLPPEDEHFEEMLRSRLKRHIVERCLYGVDINPMAVELARLALWVETLDRELPFEFLDHKLKVGNSLVGCWLHLVEDYPVLALAREGGDGAQGELTKRLRGRLSTAKTELPHLIAEAGGAMTLFDSLGGDISGLAETIRARFAELHALPNDERESAYAELRASGEFQALERSMDTWSALWFWPPGDDHLPSPTAWSELNDAALSSLAGISGEHLFFHWELEFPDVFDPATPGFDAVLGNPPWDIAKPNSQEFFSRVDPLYRSYGKTEAVRAQKRLFEEIPGLEREWIQHKAFYKAMSNYVKHAAHPFEAPLGRGRAGQEARNQWADQRQRRTHLVEPEQPYRHQGSADLNTYKLFLEVGHFLLRETGRLGMVVPSGIYTDKGTTELRRLFLENCRWEWLYGFENRQQLFPITSLWKFNPIVVQRGGCTDQVRAAFMRHDIIEWEHPERNSIELSVRDIKRFSPQTLSFMELRGNADLDLVGRIHADHPSLGEILDQAGGSYSPEFHLTNDARDFVSLRSLEAQGLLAADEDVRDPRTRARMRLQGFMPLYEGKSFWLHNPYFLARTETQSITKFVEADAVTEKAGAAWKEPRLCMRNIARSIDQRTYIVGLMPAAAHGNSCPTFDGINREIALQLNAVLSSLVVDYIVRMKVSANLNWFYLETIPVPAGIEDDRFREVAGDLVWRLNALGADFLEPAKDALVEPAKRLGSRLVLDCLVADLYELTPADAAYVAGCFPKYDAGVPAEHRYPYLFSRTYTEWVSGGRESAQKLSEDLAEARASSGLGFGFDEIWVPEGGWSTANGEASQLSEQVATT